MSVNYNIEGTAIIIGETQEFGSNGFKKREIVISTNDDKYPQEVKLDFTQDNTIKLDEFKVGDYVKIAFGIKGNEYNGKYYVNLNGFGIGHTKNSSVTEPVKIESSNDSNSSDDDDDLPF